MGATPFEIFVIFCKDRIEYLEQEITKIAEGGILCWLCLLL